MTDDFVSRQGLSTFIWCLGTKALKACRTITNCSVNIPLKIVLRKVRLFLGVYRPTRELFTHMETSPLGLQILSFICSSLMVIELWGFVTLTPIAERLAVELSLPVFTTEFCRGWISNTQPSACGANAPTHCATAAVFRKEEHRGNSDVA